MNNVWWKVWVGCILASLILFLSVAFTEAGRSPSPNWSRQIEVGRMEGLSAYAQGGNRYLNVVPSASEKGSYLLIAHKGLSLRFVSEDGSVSTEQKLAGVFPDPDVYQTQAEKGKLRVMALVNGTIRQYIVPVANEKATGELTLEKTYPLKDVQDFICSGNELLYKDKKGFGIFQGAYKATEIENMDFLTADGKQVVVIRMIAGKRVLEAYHSQQLDEPFQQYVLNGGSRIVYDNLTTYEGKSGKGVFVEMKDNGSASSSLMHYGFKGKDNAFELTRGDYGMNPLAVNGADGKVLLLSTQAQKKGKDTLLNILAGEFDGKALIHQRYLTRSEQSNQAVAYGSGLKESLLFSLVHSSKGDVIKLSGSAPSLIERAKPLTKEEIGTVLFNFMLIFPMAIFSGMMPFLYVVFPTALIMGIVSSFKMHVMEYHYKKVLYAGIALHLVVKAYYCYTTILTNPNLPNLSKVMPYYLNSTFSATITMVLSTLAAFVVLKLRYPQWHQGDYYGTYLTFAMVDMSIFICLVMPYYASYMSLPIFY